MATSWTDPTIVVGTTNVKKVHINELRTALGNEQARRGIAQTAWDTSETIRALHVQQLRDAASNIKTFSLTAGAEVGFAIRKVHVDELRAKINTLENAAMYRSDGVSDCNAACTGLCSSTCTGTSICHSNHSHGEY